MPKRVQQCPHGSVTWLWKLLRLLSFSFCDRVQLPVEKNWADYIHDLILSITCIIRNESNEYHLPSFYCKGAMARALGMQTLNQIKYVCAGIVKALWTMRTVWKGEWHLNKIKLDTLLASTVDCYPVQDHHKRPVFLSARTFPKCLGIKWTAAPAALTAMITEGKSIMGLLNHEESLCHLLSVIFKIMTVN